MRGRFWRSLERLKGCLRISPDELAHGLHAEQIHQALRQKLAVLPAATTKTIHIGHRQRLDLIGCRLAEPAGFLADNEATNLGCLMNGHLTQQFRAQGARAPGKVGLKRTGKLLAEGVLHGRVDCRE